MEASEQIDRMIAGLTDWRGKTFARVRKAVLAADRGVVEEWKWMGSPVWSCDGMIAVANAHKGKVKLTFAYGARLADPDKLFNAGREANMRRAIGYNQAGSNGKASAGAPARVRKSKTAARTRRPRP